MKHSKTTPAPTEQEFIDTYKQAYIARFVEKGITQQAAEACFEAAEFDEIRDTPPVEAADEEMSCWEDDEDVGWDDDGECG